MRQITRDVERGMRATRLGITLIEVIVATAILALLLSILIPAVLQACRNSDTVLCRARMSQIGIATHNFEERNRRYPCGIGMLTWHFELLPDLDRTDLFRQLQGQTHDEALYGDLFNIANSTSVPTLQCPSDPMSASKKYVVNFLQCGGSTFGLYEDSDSHAFNTAPLSSRDVTDGLSMTAYVSEQMNEFLMESPDRRGVWQIPLPFGNPQQLDLFADLCEKMPQYAAAGPFDWGPLTYFTGTVWYNHIVRPNHATCLNAMSNGSRLLAGLTANSLHSGGVNVLMADGAVRFVNDNVARVVWRGMGTRNGHETFTLP